MDEALPIAKQIAEALEAAHEVGVIHRDLKPANIKVREDGTVKVLDFGLAKALDPNPEGDPSLSPTLTAAATQMGVVMGTAAYMSPEQARGKTVDRRADTWAFGVVLYEMLTGSRAFSGDTVTDVLSAILERDPEWSVVPSATPDRISDLLARCLTKDSRQRLPDVGDARIQIGLTLSEQSSPSKEAAASSHRPWPWVVAAVAATLLLVVASSALWTWLGQPESAASIGPPVVVLMDTPAPAGVYDEETRAGGGTNADDLNFALRALPVELHKETVSSTWDREDQILREQPDLILIHRSSFAHSMNLEFGFDKADHGQEDLQRLLYEIADGKLMAFLGYIGLGNPQTRVIVYSRGFRIRDAWVAEVESRFPALSGRVVAVDVPVGDDGASFRDPETAGMMKDLVEEILQLRESER